MFDAAVEKVTTEQKGLLGTDALSPDPNDVARFEEILFETNARDITIRQEPESIDPQFRRETGPWEYFTDKITLRLESIQNEDRSHLKQMATILQHGLNNTKFSNEELLLLQIRMMDTQIQLQVASKISEQVGRGVQTLYRQQG